MCNKASFLHKIVSGRAPIYLSTNLLINQSSRNSAKKLNVPIPRIDLFESILVYSGPAFSNSLPSELSFQSVLQGLKSILRFIYHYMLSLFKGVSWNHGHRYILIYITLHVLLPTCVVLIQAAHTFCVSVLCVHVVFDDKHVLMCVHACVCLPPI